jgi:hypothetical protein
MYYSTEDKTVHIAADAKAVPARYRAKVQQVDLYPAVFTSLDLRDMSFRFEAAGQRIELVLDGIAHSRQQASGMIKELESLLRAHPLRLVYFPPRTDPDGTLHGDAFLASGSSVREELVRRGIAVCQDAAQASFLPSPCR